MHVYGVLIKELEEVDLFTGDDDSSRAELWNLDVDAAPSIRRGHLNKAGTLCGSAAVQLCRG